MPKQHGEAIMLFRFVKELPCRIIRVAVHEQDPGVLHKFHAESWQNGSIIVVAAHGKSRNTELVCNNLRV